MPFLMLYVGEGKKFDGEPIVRGLSAMQFVRLLPASPEYMFCCEYRTGQDSTIIRISKDWQTIAIDGMGEASVSASLQIQALSQESFRLIDEGYTFDFVLRDFQNVNELRQAISQIR